MKNYWLYFVASLASLIGSNYFIFTHGWYLLQLTGEKASVGVTWSLFFLPSLLLLPIIGRLLDSRRLKQVLLGFELGKMLVFAVFVPLLLAHPSKALVFALAAIYGVMFAPYYSSVYVMLKRLVPPNEQTRYSHYFETSLQISNIVALFSSGFLFQSLGFLKLLTLSIGFILLGFLGMTRLKFEEPETISSPRSLLSAYNDFWAVFKKMGTEKSLSLQQMIFGIIHQMPQSVILVSNVALILYVHEVMKKGPREFGIIDAVFGFSALLISLLWARWHRLSERKAVYLGVSILAGIFLIAMCWIPNTGLWLYAAIAVYALFLVSSKIIARAAVVRMISREQMGLFSGAFQASGYVILMLLFGLVSLLSRSSSPTVLFMVLGGAMVVYGVAVRFLYLPHARQPTV